MPRKALLNIAVYGDIDVWLNGRKILSSIDTLHRVFYWNYRLNITEHLKEDDDNLLAVYIKKGGRETYFDCELLFEKKNPEEVSESVPMQEVVCYSFEGCLADIFYGTSILKTLNKMDAIDRNRIILWIMGSRSINGYFGEGYSTPRQYFAVEALKNLNASLNPFDAEYLAKIIIDSCWKEGDWEPEIEYTYYVLMTLASLNKLNMIGDMSKIVQSIASLQCSDGYFMDPFHHHLETEQTFYALYSLRLLNALDSIDKAKTMDFIIRYYNFSKNETYYGFYENTTFILNWPYDFREIFWIVKSLEVLNALERIDVDEMANHAISCWQSLQNGFYYLSPIENDYYLVMILKILGKLNMLNATVIDRVTSHYDFSKLFYTGCVMETLEGVKKYYVKVESNPESALYGVCGSGWYFANTNVTLSAETFIYNPYAEGERYFFKGWSGDVVSESQRVNITVDSNKSITANWKAQYLVTYYGPSPLSTAKHEEWYDEGEVFRINTTEVFDKDLTSDYVFDHWEVDGETVNDSTIEIRVDSPKEIKAVYRVELNLVKTILTLLRALVISIAILVATAKLASTIEKFRKKNRGN
jgi:prenyltransferase beta subunit